MNDQMPKPVIFVACANDSAHPLSHLEEEHDALKAILGQAVQNGHCELVIEPFATTDKVLDAFQDTRYRHRIAILHYAGHADSYALLLQAAGGSTSGAHAAGLAAFLAQQRGLGLVFLNGCSTRGQVQALLDAGVSAVIATSQAIDDAVATQFARRFYGALVAGATVQAAFEEAESAVQTQRGGETRHLYAPTVQETVLADRPPWELHLRPGVQQAGEWNLPDAAGDPLFGLPGLPEMDLPASPYRHLHWYRREDAELFLGRGREIRDLYERVTAPRGAPIVLLYGQSGVGKSSLLAAGLRPRLEQEYVAHYRRRDQAVGLLGTLRQALGTEDKGVAVAWKEIEAREERPLIVILDQVEETYTRPNEAQPDEMEAFLVALQGLLGDRDRRPRGKLILGFRKEWLAEIEKQLQEHKLPQGKVFLERLDRRGIVEAVTGLTRVRRLQEQYGLIVEDGLPGLIADDLLADPGSPVAPVLQILLCKLWDRARARDYGQPTFDAKLYGEIRRGGLGLDDFLDQQLDALRPPHPQAVASGLALDLLAYHTTLLGTAEERSMEEVREEYRHQAEVLPGLVKECRDLYLLVDPAENQPDREEASRLAHDTLAPHVRRRFDESDAPGQRARRILESRAVEWEDDREGTPLDEQDLGIVEGGQAGMRVWTTPEERLVAASRQERDRKRRRRRAWTGVGVLALALIVIAAGIATRFWRESERNLAHSRSREKAAQALAVELDGQFDRALLLATAATQIADTVEAKSSLLSILLRNPYLITHMTASEEPVKSLAFSLDDRILASTGENEAITLWDVNRHQPLGEPLTHVGSPVASLAFSPDGHSLSVAAADGSVASWDLAQRQRQWRFTTDHASHWSSHLWSVVFASDGRTLAAGGPENAVEIWNVLTGEPLGDGIPEAHYGAITSVALSPDRRVLAVGSEVGNGLLWDIETAKPLGRQPAIYHDDEVDVTALAFGPDSDVLASGDLFGGLRLTWIHEDRSVELPSLHRERILALRFSRDGQYLASSSKDGLITLWNLTGNTPKSVRLVGHNTPAESLAFSHDGQILASGHQDGWVFLWDAAARSGIQTWLGPDTSWASTAFRPDGQILAAGTGDGVITLWDTADPGEPVEQLSIGQPYTVTSIAYSADGRILAAAGGDGPAAYLERPPELGGQKKPAPSRSQAIVVWDTSKREFLPELSVESGTTDLAFYPKALEGPEHYGLATATNGNIITIWDVVPSGVGHGEVRKVVHAGGGVERIAFSPQGDLLASAYWGSWYQGETCGGGVSLWDTGSLQTVPTPLRRPLQTPSETMIGDGTVLVTLDAIPREIFKILPKCKAGPPRALAFSPDSRMLAAGSVGGTIRLWSQVGSDNATWDSISSGSDIGGVAFSPDEQRLTLAWGTSDGRIVLWDVAGRRSLGELPIGRTSTVQDLVFSPSDGKLLAAVTADGTLALWQVSVEVWQRRACEIANRNLTWDEWKEYFPGQEYPRICADLPDHPSVGAATKGGAN